jgi:hypothetical protein
LALYSIYNSKIDMPLHVICIPSIVEVAGSTPSLSTAPSLDAEEAR